MSQVITKNMKFNFLEVHARLHYIIIQFIHASTALQLEMAVFHFEEWYVIEKDTSLSLNTL